MHSARIITTIARKEIMLLLRNKSYSITAGITVLLMLAAIYGGYQTYRKQTDERLAAEQEKRQQWLHQDPKHPHIAAHFGNFAYMPKTPLSLFDYGLDAFTGTVVYLEPHKQNDFSFKPSETQNASLRFGELSMAMIIQVLFPLLIIFTCFTAFTGEKEQSTLSLLYSQGISFRQLYAGKFAGHAVMILALFLPAALLLAGTQIALHSSFAIAGRAMLLLAIYAVYLLLFTAAILLISAYSSSSKAAVLTSLGIWIAMVVLLPKWASNAGNDMYPLPTRYEFAARIKQDITNGLNGHDPNSARAEALKAQLLAQYHTDTVSKLPFNFEGYIMQAGEEYSSKVYDKHFGALQQLLGKQNRLSIWCSLADPFMAIKNMSMALCGTDFYTHLHFQQQAEAYRRMFVQKMNENMMLHSNMGDWDYKAGAQVFESIPPFHYKPPSLYTSVSWYMPGLYSFLFWLIIILFFIRHKNRQLNP